MKTQFLNDLELHGSFSMAQVVDDFPLYPKPGTFILKREGVSANVYCYITVGGLEAWYPFANRTNFYIHTQGLESISWTVFHGLQTTDLFVQVKDLQGNFVNVGKTNIDANRFRLDFTTAIKGTVLVVAASSINSPSVKTSRIEIDDAVVIDAAGVLINGSYVPTGASVALDIGTAVAEEARARLIGDTTLRLALDLKAASNHVHVKANVGLSNVDDTSDANKPVSLAQAAADTAVQTTAATDASIKANAAQAAALAASAPIAHVGSGDTQHAVVTTTVAGFMAAADKVKLDALAGSSSGNNTGDETSATIKTKLGITTLSGANTGDQVIPTTLPASDVYAWAKTAVKPGYTPAEIGAQPAGIYAAGTGSASGVNTGDQTSVTGNAGTATALSVGADRTKLNGITGTNTGDETAAGIRTKLGITTLSGANTGDQVLPTLASLGAQAAGTYATGTGSASGVNTGDQTVITGNAGTATVLQTARTINGVAFNGSADITLNAVDATARVASALVGAVNGVASLDAAGKVPATQLPSYVDDVLEFANLAGLPGTGEAGKIYIALDTNKTYRWSGSGYIYITSGAVDSVAGKTGVVSLVKADVGLGLVDNTADASKPVSAAQASADTAVQNTAATDAANKANAAQAASTPIAHVGSSGTQHAVVSTTVAGFMTAVDKVKLDGISGSNTGDQTLASLGAYAASNPSSFISTSGAPVQSVSGKTGVVSLVKADVGLGSVDNTSDASKPVSTAQAAADATKQATLVSGTNIKTIGGVTLLGSGDIPAGGAGGDAGLNIGYLNIPQNSQSAAYTVTLADSGKHLLHPSADTTARTFTIPANTSVAFAIGTAITFVNQNAAGVVTVAIATDTMRLAGQGTVGSRLLSANGLATVMKITATEWIISGTGLS